MAYPTSIKSFTFKRNNIDKVVADDVNTAYTEITEIERQLGGITTTSGGLAGVGVVKSDWGTGTFSTSISNWYSNDGLGARLKNIEAGLYQALVTGSFGNITTGTTTLASQSGQFPNNLQVNESTHATSRRAGATFGSNVTSWTIGQDSAGNGTRDFFIYGGTVQNNKLSIAPDGSITVGGTINGTTIPTSKTLVVTTDKLSVHASTTSAELLGVISDETGTGSLVFGTAPTLSSVTLSASAGTTPPLKLTSGTNIGTAAGGAIEYDGRVAYLTPNLTAVGGRGLLPSTFFYSAWAAGGVPLTSASTAAQSLFGVGIPLAANTTYELEMNLAILVTFTSVTSNQVKVLSSGPSFSGFGFSGVDAGTAVSNLVFGGSLNIYTSTTAATRTILVTVKGLIAPSSNGTFVPQIQFGATNYNTASVLSSSWIKITPVLSTSANGVGAWA